MKVQNTKIAGRTMLTTDGVPVLVGMVMRESTTAPGRFKAALVIPTTGEHGEKDIAPLPFASPIIGVKGRKPSGFTPEFRLEMN